MTEQKAAASRAADGRPRFGDFLPACALLVLTVMTFGVLSALPGRDQHQLAVLFPPRVSVAAAAALVAGAGGELVDVGWLPNLVIAASDAPGFARSLYKAGAWLVMNPIAARGCGAGFAFRDGSR
jgi:hypothetical protein